MTGCEIGLVQAFDGSAKFGPAYARDFAQAAEACGFHSVWVPEHVVFFEHFESVYPYPPEPGSTAVPQLPVGRRPALFDPLLTCQALAMHTSTLRVGTAVALLPLRHPLLWAREVSTLDHFSGGRFELGIGVGWLAEEYDALGVPFHERGRIADEHLAALREVWVSETSTFHGEHVDFTDAVSYPKPRQSPGPPIHIGGESDAALRRVARYGDGWYGWNMTPAQLERGLERLTGHLARETFVDGSSRHARRRHDPSRPALPRGAGAARRAGGGVRLARRIPGRRRAADPPGRAGRPAGGHRRRPRRRRPGRAVDRRHARIRPCRPSRRSLPIAGGAAAIHILDHNLVQPGWTELSSHVASTLVPLAVVAALGWAATSMPVRAGTRALATIVLGLVGTMLGIQGVSQLLGGGAGGDDWTGVVSAVAGAAAVGVGARDGWRSRRREGPAGRRWARRTLKALAVAVVAVQFGYPVVDAYVGSSLARRTVPASILGADVEDVAFAATDGVPLSGWYVPSRNGAAVVLYPGRGGTQRHARMLAGHGYGVLVMDQRGVGASGGEPNSWGWGAEHDVIGAVRYLQQRPEVDPSRIGGLGLSVGGEVMLHAAAVDDGLRAVVSEGAGIRSWNEFRETDGPDRWLLAPLTITRMAATAVFANRMPPAGLPELVPDIDVPLLLIYATQGIGGEELTAEYFRLANEPKQLWQISGGHTNGLDAEPTEYPRRVIEFFDQALLG